MPDMPGRVPNFGSNRPPRRKTSERGYGTDHQRQRAELIRKYPLCQRCGSDWSRQLHHIDRNPNNRHPDNLEMLCKRCHQIEHASD